MNNKNDNDLRDRLIRIQINTKLLNGINFNKSFIVLPDCLILSASATSSASAILNADAKNPNV